MKSKIQPLDWALLIFLAVTWGCSFFFMKRGLAVFSWDEVAAMRIGLSSVFFMSVLAWRWQEVPHDRWRYTTIVGLCGSTIPAFLFVFAQQNINSSLAGILNTTTPLWILILGALFFGVSLTRNKIWGILLGLFGAATLVFFRPAHGAASGNENNWYAVFIIIATCFYGISSNVIKTYLNKTNPIIASSMSFLTVGVPCLLYLAFFSHFFEHLQNPNAYAALGYLLILAIINTFIGNIAYYLLIQRTDAVIAGVVTYFIPIISIIIGVFDNESIAPIQLLGLVLILSGVYLVSKRVENTQS